MRIVKTDYTRSTRSARWSKVGEEVPATGLQAATYWDRVKSAMTFNRSIGGYERLSVNELTSISPDRLSKSVFLFC